MAPPKKANHSPRLLPSALFGNPDSAIPVLVGPAGKIKAVAREHGVGLIDQMGMSTAAVQTLFYHDCGLKGLSGISNDVRELEASNDQRAAFALEYFVYRIGLHAGMLAAALGGVDGFVFTAGIGENSVSLRSRITEKLQWLGATLDPEANASHGPLVSRRDSRIAVYVIPTDEELMIARHTMTLLGNSRKQLTERATPNISQSQQDP